MKVFQIGFNKCGTRSLHHLFESAGYKCAHWEKGAIARDIGKSMTEGAEPLLAWPDVVLFSDMELLLPRKFGHFEGAKQFAYLHKCFPDAKFILNKRDVEDWLFSRLDHNRGTYARNYRKHYELTSTRELFDHWRRDWEDHFSAVRSYFAPFPGTLFEFDIKNDPIDKLKEFFAPHLDLSKDEWAKIRSSKQFNAGQASKGARAGKGKRGAISSNMVAQAV